MDKRRFFINLISNFLGALSGLGISFFLTPYIVETLGKDSYGFYPLANNFVVYAGILTTALNSMSGRFITISLEKQDVKEVNVYFNSVLFGNLLFALFFLLLSILFCFFIAQILNIPPQLLPDVRLLFVCIFISLLIGLASSVFSVAAFALNRFDILAFNNIVVNLLKLVFIVVLFYFFTPHIYYLGLVTVITSLYFLWIGYRNTKKLLPYIKISKVFFSWSTFSLLVGAGIWNSIMAISTVINSQLDLLIANKFFNAAGMGLLSLTKFAPNSAQLLLSIVVPIFLPDMLKAFANQDMDKLKTNLDFSFKAIFFVVLIPLAIFFVYGEDFFKLWLPGEDHHTLYLISLITLFPIIVHATIETVYHVFVITNKLQIASLWGIFIAVANLLLVVGLCRYSNLQLYAIPVAALITGLISHLIFTPLYASYCLKESYLYFLIKIGKGLLGFVCLVGVGYIWKILISIAIDTWLTFIVQSVMMGLVIFILALFIYFDKKALLYFKNKYSSR